MRNAYASSHRLLRKRPSLRIKREARLNRQADATSRSELNTPVMRESACLRKLF
ncbi:MAG TPA: hypothetical protein VFV28_10800 [Limnobacter sp.]|nr:hypothetical protein [Limnobacter sp.]